MTENIQMHDLSRLSYLLEGFADIDQQMDCHINALSLDSRNVEQGDLFFACAGTQGHGLDYINQVCDSGAAAIAWEPTEEYREVPLLKKNIPVIAVKNLAHQVGIIADRFYGRPSRDLCVIGITGTDGKTSCSHFLASALSIKDVKVGVIGTIGYGAFGKLSEASHTTPDVISVHRLLHEMRESGMQYVVIEVSSHGLDQGRVNGVLFDVAVLTNVSRDHLDYHGDQASYAKAKEKLFHVPGLACAVINRDDNFGRQWLSTLPDNRATISYGESKTTSQYAVTISNIQLTEKGINWHASSSWGKADFSHSLYGAFNVYNLAATLSVLGYLGISWNKICDRLQAMNTVPGRMELCRVPENDSVPAVMIDFAHTPEALEQVLLSLGKHGFGRIWCVFGCGGDRDKGKRSLMGQIAEQYADEVILTNDNPRTESAEQIINDILSGLENPAVVHIESDRENAIEWAIASAMPHDIVLVAGKGHESYQLIGDEKRPFSDRDIIMANLKKVVH
ncbi:MAG: UDP-N-acetylmuramoyl-L-alanyl-D-glutamate--2,6-diaminopimelate ligase [Gammaproteobacteria bacterium]|nr:UDP-N-acetylmuramoyl-L-alanyl-D-glutamate--2,6-diaminopimelate ligase [Gammaproteobacteria bacterium]